MRPEGLAVLQPGPQRLTARLQRGIRLRIRPLAQQGLDEALGLAVRAWRVRPCPPVVEPELCVRVTEGAGHVAAAVVREQAVTCDPARRKPGDCALQEGGAVRAVLRGEHLDIGDARVIVDRHVGVLPAGPGRRLLRIAMDTMAAQAKAPERLDTQVHEIARARPFSRRTPCTMIRRVDGFCGHHDEASSGALLCGERLCRNTILCRAIPMNNGLAKTASRLLKYGC